MIFARTIFAIAVAIRTVNGAIFTVPVADKVFRICHRTDDEFVFFCSDFQNAPARDPRIFQCLYRHREKSILLCHFLILHDTTHSLNIFS